ncbi:hypothetical protein [Nitrobacter winogradskyi]|uniref:Uncharacterized protein n=1 Tax=Nitrobacter winogradskyi TaxID=913 RepID=A0ACC6ALJ8_NITWI|nr:hypothetical protein [Nitrobacter winogradskyi]
MGPSFSRKNGVRYRFYVSTALRGRKHLAGSVKRVSATEIEQLIERTIRERLNLAHTAPSDIFGGIDRAVINTNHIRIMMKPAYTERPIEIPWRLAKTNAATVIEPTGQSKSDPSFSRPLSARTPGSTTLSLNTTTQSRHSLKPSNSIPNHSPAASARVPGTDNHACGNYRKGETRADLAVDSKKNFRFHGQISGRLYGDNLDCRAYALRKFSLGHEPIKWDSV